MHLARKQKDITLDHECLNLIFTAVIVNKENKQGADNIAIYHLLRVHQ